MSRLSYGGGFFSPVRNDTSLNDFEGHRESDIFEQWKDICGLNSAENNVDLPEVFSDEKKDSTFNVKPIDKIFANNLEKNLRKSSDSSKNKLSYITTRRKTTTQSKQTSPENPPETSVPAQKEVKTNRKKDSLSKYVSVRSEVGKGNESRSSKSRLSSNSYMAPTLPSLTEEQVGMKSLSPENNHTSVNKTKTTTSSQCEVKMVDKDPDRKDNGREPLTSLEELFSKERDICFSTNCEVQTDLSMSEINCSSCKTLGNFASCNCKSTTASNLPISLEPQQIQANIIEKLVKDTVSFEFDGIRQMLYLQQLSLFRYMDKKFEIERDNSALLTKCIESLMEENNKLRKEVTAYQNFLNI